MMFKLPLCVPFFRAAWAISGDGEQGRLAIYTTRFLVDPNRALAMAMAGMARNPSPQIAAWAGFLSGEQDDLGTAKAMLHEGKKLGLDPSGDLELLALQIAARDPQQDLWEVAWELFSRRDLSPSVSRIVHTELMWAYLLSGQPVEASQLAELSLEIEERGDLRMGMWAAETMFGEDRTAQMHYDRADLPRAMKIHYEIMGRVAMEDTGGIGELLRELRQLDSPLAANMDHWLAERGNSPW